MSRHYDIILMTYCSFFNCDERDRLGISLEDNVILFDEAHNCEDMSEESESLKIPHNELPYNI